MRADSGALVLFLLACCVSFCFVVPYHYFLVRDSTYLILQRDGDFSCVVGIGTFEAVIVGEVLLSPVAN